MTSLNSIWRSFGTAVQGPRCGCNAAVSAERLIESDRCYIGTRAAIAVDRARPNYRPPPRRRPLPRSRVTRNNGTPITWLYGGSADPSARLLLKIPREDTISSFQQLAHVRLTDSSQFVAVDSFPVSQMDSLAKRRVIVVRASTITQQSNSINRLFIFNYGPSRLIPW